MKARKQLILLDELDWTILSILQENAKETYSEIGRRLNLAHSTVYDRVKKLEKHGIIKRYTVVIDLQKAGLKRITAIITVFADPKESEKVAGQLAKHEQVLEVYMSLSEELLVIAKVTAEDQERLHSFIAQFVAPLPGVLRIRTSVITRKYKQKGS